MPEQTPRDKLVTVGKMIAICILCFGLVYAVVALVT